MFQVERWLGGESRKHGSPLLLDRLNARARERAALLSREKAEGSSPGNREKVSNKDSDPALSRDESKEEVSEVVVEEEFNAVSETVPHTRRKKRKQHQEHKAELATLIDQEASDSAVKVKKHKKLKVSDTTEEHVFPLEAPASPGTEEQERKVNDTLTSEDNTERAKENSAADIDRSVPELVEFQVSKLEKKRKKEKRLKIRRGGNLEPDGGPSEQINEEEPDSKSLGVPDEDEEHVITENTDELNALGADDTSRIEPDFSTIERDVDRIMGRDVNLVPAESQDHGPVLPWMRDPLDIDTYKATSLREVPGLDTRLQDALSKAGIQSLFPVQMAVWHETVGPGLSERDVCVSSPTGSGKTLSYALPIVQKLSSRVLRLLRVLVVLPTRDLAAQVKAVFDTIAPAVGLSVGLAVGQTSIVAEAAELVQIRKSMVHSFGKSEAATPDLAESQVDILVATPGRLMDHIRNTKGFTLQHLQFLVVDETDRLLRQSYQEWLPNVLACASASGPMLSGLAFRNSHPGSVRTIRNCCLERGNRGTALPRLMKMVLSATLTRDPAKIAQLGLFCPIYVAPGAAGNRYQLPEQLKSYRMVCKPGEKPLYLVALLQQLCSQTTIVFTASVMATHRLYTLLKCYKGLSFKVVEYSSLQHQQARSKALAKFRNGQAQVLIASDAMTRGMDVEGVANVVNYDMPVYAKTYVHRVGRTARAGQPGSSYTLLRKEEVRHFKQMLKKVDNSKCKDYSLPSSVTEELYESYTEALEKLKQITADEAASISHGSRTQTEGENKVTGPDELFI
ncbi:ATP-dependent RNA helicase DDX51/DBP6 [Marchantia polymorpha subsp. ruderalis]|uniref:RNA helicase n=2 Tax=Marchantia polymorpha TaxID=3197 RepID=A0AAF6B2Z9_MARPO|nr:hypothetical protein MARPO_0149s0031 [Marchantia polymorpha]BBN06383.1 hypothetical protein Mp_3g20650 [Marchantia polymorpha subsp. ruderalis]|eukprot:PTQ29039.1 hypothetical protein MARPO_0149s0031 [Marchantia polymorpha]